MADTLKTLEQVADLWQVSHWTVRRLIRDGQLPHVRVRGQYRFRDRDLDLYLSRQTNARRSAGGAK